jgi:uncharacterized protein involved in exopolysaccharide biosynthesis
VRASIIRHSNTKKVKPDIESEETKIENEAEIKRPNEEKNKIQVESQKLKEKIKEVITKIKEEPMQEDYKESTYYFIRVVLRWKMQFIVVSLAAIVLSVLFSAEWFIKPKFKSTAIIYPSNIIPYSTESPSEQMLQLFESSDIRDAVINKFKLAEHYGIDTNSTGGISKLIARYESNVEIKRTQYESIEIKVLDENPGTACAIANEIIKQLNLKARALQRQKTGEVLVIVKNQLERKHKSLDSLDVVLKELRIKYQILDYDMQAKEVTKAYLKSLSGGKSKVQDVDVMLRNLEEKGGEYYEAKKTYDALLGSYNATRIEYDNVLKDLTKELTYTNVVTKPAIADKKSYPVRWLIVTVSFIASNMFLFLMALIFDIRKKLAA